MKNHKCEKCGREVFWKGAGIGDEDSRMVVCGGGDLFDSDQKSVFCWKCVISKSETQDKEMASV